MSRYVVPSFTERTSYGVKESTPYTRLFEDRVVFLATPIDETSANDVMAQLLTLESMDPDADINLYINSPGGEFTAMTAIYDTMLFIRPQVHTVCIGQAASAAAVLLAAGSPGKRAMLPHARVLLHEPHTQGGYGQSSDMEIAAREVLRMRELQERLLARHTGREVGQIRRDLARDRVLTAADAKGYGLVDEVYTSRKRSLAAVG
ncbi:ATP-dependent Clp protease proteolytic subunit [Thermoactinospora rubra]|uniref:ATP-dependent Clp protease proteolytic subunit n=1 Tax=Thermoactinospora rubra TaxID=1088767 RepID=UPI000A114D9F|nr:ATP-dependent Clp protease proteolytic subunit [Thermoactinospora rubra]